MRSVAEQEATPLVSEVQVDQSHVTHSQSLRTSSRGGVAAQNVITAEMGSISKWTDFCSDVLTRQCV